MVEILHGREYLIDHLKTLKTQHLNKVNCSQTGEVLLFYRTPRVSFYRKFLCFEENDVEIATVSSTAPQSDEECSKSKVNQTANTENTNVNLKTLRLKNVN